MDSVYATLLCLCDCADPCSACGGEYQHAKSSRKALLSVKDYLQPDCLKVSDLLIYLFNHLFLLYFIICFFYIFCGVELLICS